MVIKYFISLILLAFTLQSHTGSQDFDKKAFYSALRNGKQEDINGQLAIISKSIVSEKDAYDGSLLMRKAGLVSGPLNKLKLFKAGRIKLEDYIKKDPNNVEVRFLRVIIQEHAPGIVNYSSDLKKDCEFIRGNFKKLDAQVQQVVMEYTKASKYLSVE